MNTHGSDVSSSFTGNPEDAESLVGVVLEEVGLVDRSNAELTLHSGDQRWSLEHGAGERLDRLVDLLLILQKNSMSTADQRGLTNLDILVKLEDANVLFTGTLLRLDKSSGSTDADDKTTSNLGIEGTRVTGLLDLENSLDPSDDLVGGRIRWLVDVQNTRLDVVFDISLRKEDEMTRNCLYYLERTASLRIGSEVVGAHVELVPSLKQERPVVRVLFHLLIARLETEICRALNLSEI